MVKHPLGPGGAHLDTAPGTADFPVCGIAGFLTCGPCKSLRLMSYSPSADWEIGDTADLETGATGAVSSNSSAGARGRCACPGGEHPDHKIGAVCLCASGAGRAGSGAPAPPARRRAERAWKVARSPWLMTVRVNRSLGGSLEFSPALTAGNNYQMALRAEGTTESVGRQSPG